MFSTEKENLKRFLDSPSRHGVTLFLSFIALLLLGKEEKRHFFSWAKPQECFHTKEAQEAQDLKNALVEGTLHIFEIGRKIFIHCVEV